MAAAYNFSKGIPDGLTNIIAHLMQFKTDKNQHLYVMNHVMELIISIYKEKAGLDLLTINAVVSTYNNMIDIYKGTKIDKATGKPKGFGLSIAKKIIISILQWCSAGVSGVHHVEQKGYDARAQLTPLSTSDLQKITQHSFKDVNINPMDDQYTVCTKNEIEYIYKHPKPPLKGGKSILPSTMPEPNSNPRIVKFKAASCWLCTSDINIFAVTTHKPYDKFPSPGGEWEHVLPPGIGNLLGLLRKTVNGTIEAISQGNNTMKLGLQPSHSCCNQWKNDLQFIYFNDDFKCIPYLEAIEIYKSRLLDKMRRLHNYTTYDLIFSPDTLRLKEANQTTPQFVDHIINNIHTTMTKLCDDINTTNGMNKYANNTILSKTFFNGLLILFDVLNELKIPLPHMKKGGSYRKMVGGNIEDRILSKLPQLHTYMDNGIERAIYTENPISMEDFDKAQATAVRIPTLTVDEITHIITEFDKLSIADPNNQTNYSKADPSNAYPFIYIPHQQYILFNQQQQQQQQQQHFQPQFGMQSELGQSHNIVNQYTLANTEFNKLPAIIQQALHGYNITNDMWNSNPNESDRRQYMVMVMTQLGMQHLIREGGNYKLRYKKDNRYKIKRKITSKTKNNKNKTKSKTKNKTKKHKLKA